MNSAVSTLQNKVTPAFLISSKDQECSANCLPTVKVFLTFW